jgi:hypothetical protein
MVCGRTEFSDRAPSVSRRQPRALPEAGASGCLGVSQVQCAIHIARDFMAGDPGTSPLATASWPTRIRGSVLVDLGDPAPCEQIDDVHTFRRQVVCRAIAIRRQTLLTILKKTNILGCGRSSCRSSFLGPPAASAVHARLNHEREPGQPKRAGGLRRAKRTWAPPSAGRVLLHNSRHRTVFA